MPWLSNQHGACIDVSTDWTPFAGEPWTPELAERSLDWIDRRDIDRYLKVWADAHRRGMPLIAGCRATWPNGETVEARVVASPQVTKRTLVGLTGLTTFRRIG